MKKFSIVIWLGLIIDLIVIYLLSFKLLLCWLHSLTPVT